MEPLKLTNTSVSCETATKDVVDENAMTTLTSINSWHYLEEYNRTKQHQLDCINNSMDRTDSDDNCCANDRHDTNNEQIKKVHTSFFFHLFLLLMYFEQVERTVNKVIALS